MSPTANAANDSGSTSQIQCPCYCADQQPHRYAPLAIPIASVALNIVDVPRNSFTPRNDPPQPIQNPQPQPVPQLGISRFCSLSASDAGVYPMHPRRLLDEALEELRRRIEPAVAPPMFFMSAILERSSLS